MEHRPNTRPDPLVDADTLVGILFAGHRPSVRWLRYQTKTRTIVKRHTLCDRDGTHVIRLGMLLPSAGRKLSLAKLYTKALLR